MRGETRAPSVGRGLEVLEAARAHSHGIAVSATCLAGMIAQAWMPGALWLHVLVVTPLVALAAVGAWVVRVSRDPSAYTRVVAWVFGALTLVTASVVVSFLGVFSPP